MPDFLLTIFPALLMMLANSAAHARSCPNQAEEASPGQKWVLKMQLSSEGDVGSVLPVLLQVTPSAAGDEFQVFVMNGPEAIDAGSIVETPHGAMIDFPHFDSSLRFDVSWASIQESGAAKGVWRRRRSGSQIVEIPFTVERHEEPAWEDPAQFCGRWQVRFAKDTELSIGEFEQDPATKRVHGTFLTTTGDYRFLSGGVTGNTLTLSCFDGSHAFLFRASLIAPGRLSGTFRSGNWHLASWEGERNDSAGLPDPFSLTKGVPGVDLATVRYRNLEGALVPMDALETTGGRVARCRIIEVFGSWCPNCHDAADLLEELLEKHGPSGLAITGLAFEMTGDTALDAEQIRRFVARKKVSWPIYLAGVSDKAAASEVFPLVDRIRSYPTFVFLDGTGRIRAVYTGFSGPATGEAYARLRNQFERIIESCLE